MDLEQALREVERLTGYTPSRAGGGYLGRCPVLDHNDNSPSLSIRESKSGKLLLKCFAGCTFQDIIAAINEGVSKPPPTKEFNNLPPWERPIEAIYPYHDERGGLLFEKIRFANKDFSIRRPNGKGWSWGINGTRIVLYRLPEVIRARTVFICEGEKDSETLRKWKLVATTNFDGASRDTQKPKWKPDQYKSFFVNKHVILLPDNDEAGHAHMQFVYDTLTDVKSKTIIYLPSLVYHQDVTDWVELDHTIKELQQLWKLYARI